MWKLLFSELVHDAPRLIFLRKSENSDRMSVHHWLRALQGLWGKQEKASFIVIVLVQN
jgi:hypothetical protein